MIRPNYTIVFQGDSITDAGRARDATAPNDAAGLGRGYALMVASQLLADRPRDGLQFYNRGIGGNRIVDLYARWREDCLNLLPDVVSILVGVNDTGHEFSRQAGVPVEKYASVYRQLLQETREELPSVQLALCQPFAVLAGNVNERWLPDLEARREVVRGLAADFDAVCIDFQSVFDHALEQASVEYWLPDGVHPTAAGHNRMAQAWIDAVLNAG